MLVQAVTQSKRLSHVLASQSRLSGHIGSYKRRPTLEYEARWQFGMGGCTMNLRSVFIRLISGTTGRFRTPRPRKYPSVPATSTIVMPSGSRLIPQLTVKGHQGTVGGVLRAKKVKWLLGRFSRFRPKPCLHHSINMPGTVFHLMLAAIYYADLDPSHSLYHGEGSMLLRLFTDLRVVHVDHLFTRTQTCGQYRRSHREPAGLILAYK